MKNTILAATVGMLLAASAVHAQSTTGITAVSDREVEIRIAALPLADALQEFGRQAGLSVVMSADVARGIQSHAISGKLTMRSALVALLQGSGLQWEFLDERTVAIRRTAATVVDRTSWTNAGTVHLAQAESSASASTIRVAEGSTEVGANVVSIPEILVESKRLLNTDIERTPDDAQPYVVFNREVIERSGATNVEDFLRTRLTSSASSQSSAQLVGAGGSNASTVNLRGLGFSQTLILIDGRRVAPRNNGGGISQADLNGIPLSAIERIEILPATASGIYGGGATGGVLNVVLRRDYEGIETTLTYENSFEGGGSSRRIDLAGGFNLEDGRTNVTFAGTYSDASSLRWNDRNFFAHARSRTLANNPGFFLSAPIPPLGGTTNIRSLSGDDLTLKDQYGGAALGSAITSVPYGYAGVASDSGAAFVRNAGQYNLDATNTTQVEAGDRQSLLNAPTVSSLMMSVRRQFSSAVDAYIDLSGSKNAGSFASSSLLTSQFYVPASAPANPFNQDVFISTPAFGTDQVAESTDYNYKAVGGVIISLPNAWRAAADFTWNKNRTETRYSAATLTADADAAVASGVGSNGTPFDVFADTNAAGLSFAPYLGPNYVGSPAEATSRDAAVRIAGPLGWSLPGGAPVLSLLLEYRKEWLGDTVIQAPVFTQTAYSRWQSVKSAYVEALLPIVSPKNDVRGIRTLELQLAGRYDDYGITGANSTISIPGFLEPAEPVRVTQNLSSTDPLFSLRYQPIEDLTFRGSYATGFLPPDILLLVPDPPRNADGVTYGLTDPKRGDEFLGTFTYLSGGNPNLRPEASKSTSFGVIVEPRFVTGLRVSVDWTRIKKHDNIQSFALLQTNIDTEDSLPGYITRGPASDGYPVGPITAINTQALNVALQDVEALDLAFSYRYQTASWGTFSASIAATRNYHNVTRVSSASPDRELLGLINVLPWKANLEILWERGEWNARWETRYFDSYCLLQGCSQGPLTLSQGSTSIPSQTYHDLALGYRFPSGTSGLLSGVSINLGLINVLNKKPPIDLSSSAFYSTYGDPRLARYYVSLKKSFL